MQHRHVCLALTLLALFLVVPGAQPQDKKKPNGSPLRGKDLLETMQMPVEMEEGPMKFKEFLAQIDKQLIAKGKQYPVLINVAALKRDAQDLPDPYEGDLKIPAIRQQLPLMTVLQLALSQIQTNPPNDARLLLRNGQIEITSRLEASLSRLLQQKVLAAHEKRPLAEVLDDLAEKTGVSIVLDPRVMDKGETKITATFRNDVTLGGALRILTDMADLQVVDMKSGIYVTTAANAQNLEKTLKGVKEERQESREVPP